MNGLKVAYNHISQREELLKSALDNFHLMQLKPKIGIEWEFYLLENNLPANPNIVSDFISRLKLNLQNKHIKILDIEPEQGFGQIEVKTLPYLEIELLCQDFIKIKEEVKNLGNDDLSWQLNFSSQPYLEDCGSSMQINFSLQDQDNNLLFAKQNQQESQYLLNSVAGLMIEVKNLMPIFAPNKEDYLRFDLELNKSLHKNKKYTAPVNISWGYNNRTALIRIPDTKNNADRRLEFRLPASDADVYLVNSFLLFSVFKGIKDDLLPAKPIYGNVFDDQYLNNVTKLL